MNLDDHALGRCAGHARTTRVEAWNETRRGHSRSTRRRWASGTTSRTRTPCRSARSASMRGLRRSRFCRRPRLPTRLWRLPAQSLAGRTCLTTGSPTSHRVRGGGGGRSSCCSCSSSRRSSSQPWPRALPSRSTRSSRNCVDPPKTSGTHAIRLTSSTGSSPSRSSCRSCGWLSASVADVARSTRCSAITAGSSWRAQPASSCPSPQWPSLRRSSSSTRTPSRRPRGRRRCGSSSSPSFSCRCRPPRRSTYSADCSRR